MNEKRVYSEVQRGNAVPVGEISNMVYKTSDYDIFQLSKFNRNVFIKKEMLKQAKEGFIAPIVVNENLVVIDGQHRLEASKMVEVPVQYIITKGLGKHDIVRMNTVQKPWGMINFIEAFANQGNPEYVKLVDLLKDVYGNTTVVSQVACNVTSPAQARAIIESGEFNFFNYEKTLEFFSFLNRFKEEVKVPMKTKLSLALFELFKIKKIDKERLIAKVVETRLDDELRTKTIGMTEALKGLIDAYNKNLHKKTNDSIEYYVTSTGSLKIVEDRYGWATK